MTTPAPAHDGRSSTALSPTVKVAMFVPTSYPIRELRQSLMWSRLARFDGFMISDHWQDFTPRLLWDRSLMWRAGGADSPHELRETFTVLGALARSSGRVRIGVTVTEMLRRHPVMVAQAALTLSELTKRPPILGVGAGERLNTEPYGLAVPGPVSRLEEAIEVIRLCFQTSGTFNFRGEHFHLEGAVMDLAPPKGRVPEIWVAAHRPRMLRITGRYGDGWIPSVPPLYEPSDYERAWKAVQTGAMEAGRDPSSITPSLFAALVMAPTPGQVDAQLESKLARYWSLMGTSAHTWAQHGLDHPFGSGFRGYIDVLPEALEERELEAAMACVTPELVRSSCVYGTPRRVEARIRDYADAGLRHIVLAPLSALIRRRHQAYVIWALPRLARALGR